MLDIQIIRDDPEKVKAATKAKGFDETVIDRLLLIDEKRRKAIQAAEVVQAERNKISHSQAIKSAIEESKKGKPKITQDVIKRAIELKNELREREEEREQFEGDFKKLMLMVPNMSADDVKVGTAEDNEVIKTVGKEIKFKFTPKDHVDIGVLTDTIDLERGAKVTQSGFYYLKGDGALLEMALISFALNKLSEKGFTPVITPNLAREKNVIGCGFQARSDKERQIYHIEDEDLDLIATAEITLVGMHTDEVIEEKNLPTKYVGYSSCYRKEIGSYGKDVRGILRVHEFRKVEMVVFCKPEESEKIHDELLAIEEEVWKDLGIPYQVVKMATGDLGNAASKKYDIEAWMPSQEKYREVTSTSNTTDFQTRRLNIKYRKSDKNEYLHSLNGTVFALGRAMIAIYENFQNEDGSVDVPKVLHKWMSKEKIEIKK